MVVLKERKAITFGTGRDQLPKAYEYVRLAEEELGSLTTTERDLLVRLGIHVHWAGRYPMKIKSPLLADLAQRRCSPADQETIAAFCQRILEPFESLT
jgi:hypothetical protein